jgi:hypothetical protein
MSRYVLAGLLVLPALLISSSSAKAQCLTCMSFGKFIHQHGPYYNYSAAGCGGYGYGCGAGYGCYSGGNHAPMSRGWIGGGGLFGHGGGCGYGGGWGHGGGWAHGGGLFHHNNGCNSCGRGGWGHYALSTFRNVFHRCHPCGRSGGWDHGYSSAGCSTCGTTATPAAAQPATLPTK